MASEVKIVGPIQFGEGFELDLNSYELRRAGRVLKLERIPAELLVLLIEERRQLVSRDRIIERIWGKDVFLDTDNSINAAVHKIRQVLKDDPEQPQFVQTITGRGYRFIAQVEEAGVQRSVVPSPPQQSIPPLPTPTPTKRNRTRLAVALALLGFVIAGSAIWLAQWLWHRTSGYPPIRSIAVLPLENFSGDSSQNYFVDSITNELITNLVKISALRVTSRTSVMRYKGTKKSLPEIARELNVDGIVEGSVTRSGQRVRVTAQLLRAPTDQHLWADTYESDLGDVLKLQSEVAQAIAQQVRVEVTPQQEVRLSSARPVNPEAYEAYLKGRYYLSNQFTTAQPLNTARGYFEEAVRKDPRLCTGVRRACQFLSLLGFFPAVAGRERPSSRQDSPAQSSGTG